MTETIARTDLAALLERVRKATGPDRELDYEIPLAVEPPPPTGFWTTDREYYPPITSSIDAALGLVERVLPGWSWRVGAYNLDRVPRCELAQPVETEFGPGIGVRAQVDGPTAPLAILAAMLTALEDRR